MAHLARLRRVTRLTQQALADASGVSQKQISQIESAKSNPRLDTLLALGLALGVELVFIPKGHLVVSPDHLDRSSFDGSPNDRTVTPSALDDLIISDEDADA